MTTPLKDPSRADFFDAYDIRETGHGRLKRLRRAMARTLSSEDPWRVLHGLSYSTPLRPRPARIPWKGCLLIFLTLVCSTTDGVAGDVFPAVQLRVDKHADPIKVDETWNIAYSCSRPIRRIARHLQGQLSEEFLLPLDVVPLCTMREAAGDYHKDIVLGRLGHPRIAAMVRRFGIDVDSRIGEEGYVIESFSSFKNNLIAVIAETDVGVFHAIQSLLKRTPDDPSADFQLLSIERASGQVLMDDVHIADWPDKPIRGVQSDADACIREAAIDDLDSEREAALAESCHYQSLERLLPKMARWKMNLLAVGGRVPTTLSGTPDGNVGEMPRLYKEALDLYITPIPTLKGLASADYMLRSNYFATEAPHLAEGISSGDERFRVNADGYFEPEATIELDHVPNLNFALQVTREIPVAGVGWRFYPSTDGSHHWTWESTEVDEVVVYDDRISVASGVVKGDVDPDWVRDHRNAFSSMLLSSPFEVESETTYVVSFWAKTHGLVNGDDGFPQVTVVQRNGSAAIVSPTAAEINTVRLVPCDDEPCEWRQYFLPLRTHPDTESLVIYSRQRKNGYGTYWLDDFGIRRMDGALTNVIRHPPTTDVRVTRIDADGSETAFYEDVDYTVSGHGVTAFYTSVPHPDYPETSIHYRFYPRNDSLVIRRVEGGGIEVGDEVLVSYDFHMAINSSDRGIYSIRDPDTYDTRIFPYIDALLGGLVTEIPGHSFDFVLYGGADEVRGINRDSRNVEVENYELIAEDISEVLWRVKEHHSDTRMIVWADMFNPWHHGNKDHYQADYGGRAGKAEPDPWVEPDERVTAELAAEWCAHAYTTECTDVPEIIPAVWEYGVGDPRGIIGNSPDYFEALGFKWVAAPGSNEQNIAEWTMAINGRPDNLGIIATTYSGFGGVDFAANCVWRNDQPECRTDPDEGPYVEDEVDGGDGGP